MSLWKKIKQIFYKALKENNSPSKLALSFAVGIFIAFSPIPGGHTVMMFGAKWLFDLNFPILFLSTSFNNPWTVVPFFAFDYSFGYWLLHSFFGWHPSWIISLKRIFGAGSVCLWSFLTGGMVLGIVAATISYPVMLWIFRRMAAREVL